jgi:nitrogen-specific signal transduction histidine kinase
VGLGLALVRELCAALGARVELQSTPGSGSTFTVLLPVASVDTATSDEKPEAQRVVESDTQVPDDGHAA